MPDPSKLTRHLPGAFSTDANSDQYKLLSGLESGFDSVRAVVEDLENEQTLTKGEGFGLDRKVQSYGLFRPPGLSDSGLRALATAIVGARRGTLAAIKTVCEVATGIEVEVNDRQTDATIPRWEIQISPVAGSVWPAYGRGLYAGIGMTEVKSSKPLHSAVAGPLIEETGFYGGFINDFAWFPVDSWTLILLGKVRPAGTYYKFVGG